MHNCGGHNSWSLTLELGSIVVCYWAILVKRYSISVGGLWLEVLSHLKFMKILLTLTENWVTESTNPREANYFHSSLGKEIFLSDATGCKTWRHFQTWRQTKSEWVIYHAAGDTLLVCHYQCEKFVWDTCMVEWDLGLRPVSHILKVNDYFEAW